MKLISLIYKTALYIAAEKGMAETVQILMQNEKIDCNKYSIILFIIIIFQIKIN